MSTCGNLVSSACSAATTINNKGMVDMVLMLNALCSWFKADICPTTPFAIIQSEHQQSGGNTGFGGTAIFPIDRIADLLAQAYLEIDLPGLGLSGDLAGNTLAQPGVIVANQPNGVSLEPFWCRGVGYALITEVMEKVGNGEYDKMGGEFLFLYEELAGRPGARTTEMVGNFATERALQLFSRQRRRLYVPLQFAHMKEESQYFPYAALLYNTVSIQFMLRHLVDVIRVPLAAVIGGYLHANVNSRADIVAGAINNTNFIQAIGGLTGHTGNAMDADGHLCLLVNHILLDEPEHNAFADGQLTYLHVQHQSAGFSPSNAIVVAAPAAPNNLTQNAFSTNATATLTVDLQFSNPVAVIYAVARLACREAVFGASNQNVAAAHDWMNFSGFPNPVSGIAEDPLTNIALLLNNQTKISTQAAYFRLVQPFEAQTNIPSSTFIYQYSFARRPEDWTIGSGSANLGRIDSKKLTVTFSNMDFTSAPGGNNSPLPQNETVNVGVFALSWNALYFELGYGTFLTCV